MKQIVPTRKFDTLLLDTRGGVLVEFAILAPAIITLLLGVIQVGLHVQNSNAVRNLAADGARFAVVQYQSNQSSPNDVLETWIRARAVGGRYNLNTDRLEIDVTDQTTRIGGTIEKRIEITYSAPTYISAMSGETLDLTYVRPVFLIAD